ncbi:peptidoglycan-associated lipoprotein Pal [Alkanindiges sp. WGS2144]|uniref:peptidoglycan-associated lipoprotein Pal n=1 Tax=Alkanindiges sp. WGS2144 TaxID=3366808 RepID=UPI003753AB51
MKTLSSNAIRALLIPGLAVALTMTGCANRKPATSATTSNTSGSTAGNTGASSSGIGNNGNLSSTGLNGNGPMDAVRQALMARVVHFDYDSSDLSQTDLNTLNAHARYLSQNNAARITLTGHTDERGTREYNMALGERRAKSVEAFLVTNGARNEQIETVSYGKEQPVNEGHNEAAWAQNRRVEINYSAGAPN